MSISGGIYLSANVLGRPHLKEKTLPELLRENVYETSVIGKWHIHSWPQDIGFDSYLIPRVHHCHSGQFYTENDNGEFAAPGFSVEYECERAQEFFKTKQNSEKPSFLYYNISPPHCPLKDAPAQYTKMYDPADVPLRKNVNPKKKVFEQDRSIKVYCWDFRHYSFHLPYTEKLPDGFGIRDITALYYGMVSWADDIFGRILSSLKKNGLAENTIIIFTADHMHGNNLYDILCVNSNCCEQNYAVFETEHGVGIRTSEKLYYKTFLNKDKHTYESSFTQCYNLSDDPYEFNNIARECEFSPEGANLNQQFERWDIMNRWL